MIQKRFVFECIDAETKKVFVVRDFQSGFIVKVFFEVSEIGDFFDSILVKPKDSSSHE